MPIEYRFTNLGERRLVPHIIRREIGAELSDVLPPRLFHRDDTDARASLSTPPTLFWTGGKGSFGLLGLSQPDRLAIEDALPHLLVALQKRSVGQPVGIKVIQPSQAVTSTPRPETYVIKNMLILDNPRAHRRWVLEMDDAARREYVRGIIQRHLEASVEQLIALDVIESPYKNIGDSVEDAQEFWSYHQVKLLGMSDAVLAHNQRSQKHGGSTYSTKVRVAFEIPLHLKGYHAVGKFRSQGHGRITFATANPGADWDTVLNAYNEHGIPPGDAKLIRERAEKAAARHAKAHA